MWSEIIRTYPNMAIMLTGDGRVVDWPSPGNDVIGDDVYNARIWGRVQQLRNATFRLLRKIRES
jgi:hypothetical protein